jgi:hypothetical protein
MLNIGDPVEWHQTEEIVHLGTIICEPLPHQRRYKVHFPRIDGQEAVIWCNEDDLRLVSAVERLAAIVVARFTREDRVETTGPSPWVGTVLGYGPGGLVLVVWDGEEIVRSYLEDRLKLAVRYD